LNLTAKDLIKRISSKETEYSEKRSTRNRLLFITTEKRQDLIKKIANDLKVFGAKVMPGKHSISSVGYVSVGTFLIILKDKLRRKSESLNGLNEKKLEDLIKNLTSNGRDPINFILSDGKRQLICEEVVSAHDDSKNTSGNRKSDITIIGKKNKYPVSIKLPSADFYASYSSDKEISKIAKAALQEITKDPKSYGIQGKVYDIVANKYRLNVSRIGIDVISDKNIIKDGMFGSDIEGHGCIAVFDVVTNLKCKPVDPKKYKLKPDFQTFLLECELVLTSMQHIKKDIMGHHYPMLSLQNHVAKRIDDMKGIECRLSTTRNVKPQRNPVVDLKDIKV